MKRAIPVWISLYWLTTALTFVIAAGLALFFAPVESTMGVVQKIFYIHLPSAINTFVACLVVFTASIGYLVRRDESWDDLAASAAKAAVIFCSVVLITGMIWAKQAWGTWWTWSPRLTFSLLLWLLYVVYLINRASIDSSRRRAVVSAVYGVVAFLDVPLVYLSARLLPDIHPTSMSVDVRMKLTLAFWFLPVTLLNAGFIAAGYAIERRLRSSKRARDVEGPRPMRLELLRGGLS